MFVVDPVLTDIFILQILRTLAVSNIIEMLLLFQFTLISLLYHYTHRLFEVYAPLPSST